MKRQFDCGSNAGRSEPLHPTATNPESQARMQPIDHDQAANEVEVERYELNERAPYRFEVERREFMRIFAAMGGGLLVVASVPRAGAQESGRGGQGRAVPREIAGWLHIDGKGLVTTYTGKTEIGQNIRTSLAQAIADELRVPLSSVTMVMADTDLVPYDQGTFGSQSTPRMAPQLARAAAAAREMLIGQAAALWQADRGSLSARDGRVVAADGRTIGYGELTKGQKLAGTIEGAAVVPPEQWTLRGKAPKKVNGRDFVTGRHDFTPDIVRPGMLHGRVVRPEGYAGTLVSADDSRAKAIEGVSVVRDGEFLGVVAPTERAARRAAAAIRAEWRAPSGHPSSETIYEYLKKNARPGGGGRGGTPTTAGDVAQGRASAARTFEATYRIPYIAHVPLEPRAAVAEWADGRLTVWCGTQRPFGVRSELATAFRIPEDTVRVIVPDTGSAYGGKHSGEHAIEAARLARAAGKPVKLVWTRAEEFSFGYARPAGVIDVKAAVDSSGRLIAWEFDNWNSGGSAIRTPYDVPNQRIQFHQSDSPLRQGSYRGLAATANHYVREMHMDAIARALGADAVEFRLRHLKDERMRAVLTTAAERIGWPKTSSGRTLGIACGTEKASYVATAAEVSKAPNGFRVERLVVVFECGAVVNRDGLLNQVEGAVVQGLGGALFEALEFSNGQLSNGTMELYRVPRFKDIPPIEVVLLDRNDIPSAGAGETPIVCVAPAIGSAVRGIGPVAEELPVRLV
ncbi:MAG TPA: molybdopterin cofactor-binding domain-containing protein [Vicinamibacterales bacterium]|nr:molybdopterin cofactor-binding domain-containing protein [Vicinamibacterales bacterium]